MVQHLPLLFDLDGTLTNPAPGFFASVRYALEKLEVDCPGEQELKQYIGPPLRDSFRIIIDTDEVELIERAVELYRWRLDNGGKFEAKLIPGIEAVLEKFKQQGFPLYICTGKPEGVAAEIIEHFGLAKYFNHVYGAKLDGRHCDKADLIQHIWQREKISIPNGIMIGDTVFDMRGAKANKLATVGVRWGFGEDSELLAAGADYLVSDAEELIDTLELLIQKLGTTQTPQ